MRFFYKLGKKNNPINTMLNEIKIFKKILNSKDDPYLGVDFEFYTKWKLLLRILVSFNKNYIWTDIFRKKYKFNTQLAVIGLKTSGQNVKRRTKGFAKEFLSENIYPKCIFCHEKLTEANATTDHIIPISQRGTNAQVNLVVCCDKCNVERGNTAFYTYFRKKNPSRSKDKYIFI